MFLVLGLIHTESSRVCLFFVIMLYFITLVDGEREFNRKHFCVFRVCFVLLFYCQFGSSSSEVPEWVGCGEVGWGGMGWGFPQ